ncbi:MAG: hypothetical protein KGZ63_05270 [Clostridiales bacterium]|jgi:hypothetical protein|nr:hypothetical protein [Clostridiales bacterium]
MEVKDWLLLGVIGLSAMIWRLRGRRSRIVGRKPGKSNSRAVLILEEAGYTVEKVKPAVQVRMTIDDKLHTFELKGDYLVAKSGRRYLVRLRRDGKPMRLQSKMWRNSLLRDVQAFGTTGIIMLDTEKETLHEVSFRI